MDINKTLLKKYFSGQFSQEEQETVLDYLSNENSDFSMLNDLLEQEQQDVQPKEIPPVLLRSLVYGLRKETFPHFLKKPAKVIASRSWWYSVAAAAVLLPVVLVYFFYTGGKKQAGPSAAIVSMEKWDTVVNRTPYVKKAVLPDGSRIWLASQSQFSYSHSAYGQYRRTIRLEGEAFFDVAYDPSHPFVVQHGPVSTHVLGTAFNVEAYAKESDVRISLVRGRVAINASSDTALKSPLRFITPGHQLSYRYKDGGISVKPLVYQDEVTWTKGWMVLNDVPLQEALGRLEGIYGVKIVVPRNISLSGKKVTAIFRGGTLPDILQNMLFAHRLRYEERDKIIYIRKPVLH